VDDRGAVSFTFLLSRDDPASRGGDST